MVRQAQPGDYAIETDRLSIRSITPADLAAFHAIAAQPDVARMLASLPHPLSREGAAAWLAERAYAGRPGFAAGLYRREGGLIGCIGLTDDPRTIYYFLGPDHWGQGYATEALTAFLDDCARRFGLTEIRAGAMHDNLGSHRVLEKAGFRFTHAVRHRPPVRPAPDRLFMFWKGFGAPPPLTVQTARLFIVPIRAPYAERLSVLGNDPVVARMQDDMPLPFDKDRAAAWIAAADPTAGRHRLAVTSLEGFLLGACKLTLDGSAGRFDGWLGRESRGRGLGGEALRGLAAEAFARWPDVAHLDCAVMADNPAALHILEGCGAQAVGETAIASPARDAPVQARILRIAATSFMTPR